MHEHSPRSPQHHPPRPAASTRRGAARLLLGCVLCVLWACESSKPAAQDLEDDALDAVADQAFDDGLSEDEQELTPPAPLWLGELHSEAEYELLVGEGDELKYLSRLEERSPPPAFPSRCVFQNMTIHQWHLTFLRSLEGFESLTVAGYSALVLVSQTRQLWGGGVYTRPSQAHPLSGAAGVFAFTVYTEPGPNTLRPPELAEVFATLSDCAPALADKLVFVPSSPEQQQMVVEQSDWFAAQGVPVLPN